MTKARPKAIVFTHFTLPRSVQPIEFPLYRARLSRCCRDRVQMYADCPSVGLVYLFVAEGYQAILGDSRPWEGLERERILRDLLEAAIAGKDVEGKVQVVGTRELTPTMAAFSRAAAHAGYEGLGHLLLGFGKHMHYDSPKVVEAIIRLARARRFGKESIFRFDADVEVDDQNVRRLLDYYVRQSGRHHYFFSGGYRSRRPEDERCELLNRYAVRVAQFCDQGGGVETLDRDKARRFLRDLRDIGADPETQVISGAGLCMSPEAIRMLPPFANVGEQIMWIDDHLKRVLHEDLHHFGHPQDARRRCEEATFVQDRYPPPDGVTAQAVGWHRGEYLERLVRGCLLDALIQDRSRRRRGVVAYNVETLKRTGLRLPKPQLQEMLREPANRRLGQIVKKWQAPHYRGSAVHDFAQSLAGGSGGPLIDEVIDAVDAYLSLLGIWGQFVSLCEHADRRLKANRWLFREPV